MSPYGFSRRWLLLSTLLYLLGAVFIPAPGQGVQAAGTRYYVRANGGSDSNSGLSWAQAFKTLQAALTGNAPFVWST